MKIYSAFKAAGAMALAAFLCPVGITGNAVAQDDTVLDPQALLPGYWGWESSLPERADYTCDTNPMRIWFTEEGTRYNSQTAGTVELFTSEIIFHLPSTAYSAGFLIQYDGEERVDAEGNLVSWFLIMDGPDQFYWVERNWVSTGGRTDYLVRCQSAIS
jgi:hypothetical protein